MWRASVLILLPFSAAYLQDGKAIVRTFKHIASEIGAYEAEEVGVEHLLRVREQHRLELNYF